MPQWTTYASIRNKDRCKSIIERAFEIKRPLRTTACSLVDDLILNHVEIYGDCSDEHVQKYNFTHAMALGAHSWYNEKSCTHVFISESMASFLISCCREISQEYLNLKSIIKLMPISETVNDLHETLQLFGFFIHYEKNNNSGSSIHISFEKIPKRTDILTITSGDSGFIRLPVDIKEMSLASKETDKFLQNAKILFGLSLYLEAFPDALQEFQAPSKEFKRKQTLTLRIPKEVQEDIDHSVSPHYRRGHMRLLTSERYTEEKRGKAVFVKGCFVKGKAYEVVG